MLWHTCSLFYLCGIFNVANKLLENMKRFLLLAGMLSFAFVSCQKDDSAPSEKMLLPTKIYWYNSTAADEGVYCIEFGYDINNRLSYFTNVIFQEDPDVQPGYYNFLSLNEDGMISKDVISGGERYYSYDGNSVYISNNQAHMEWDEVIQLNDKGWMKKYTSAAPSQIYHAYTSADYGYDIKGNIAHMEYVDYLNIPGEKNYDWDDKKGIFSSVNTPQWYLVNMWVDGFNYVVNNELRPGDVYAYNESGYPVSIVRKAERGEDRITIEYSEANPY